ncbi:MAG: hypothetical protein ACRCVV_06860 [Shewanella sp.]
MGKKLGNNMLTMRMSPQIRLAKAAKKATFADDIKHSIEHYRPAKSPTKSIGESRSAT